MAAHLKVQIGSLARIRNRHGCNTLLGLPSTAWDERSIWSSLTPFSSNSWRNFSMAIAQESMSPESMLIPNDQSLYLRLQKYQGGRDPGISQG